MAGAKKATPPPIDRPLSRAYLRNFTGWSTAYPPGLSDPTSCRQMENMTVTRDRGLAVRPGLRYMSYLDTPDMDPGEDAMPGIAFDKPIVGSLEPFYVDGGRKAMLFACRETDGTVGFRALLLSSPDKMVYNLTDPEIGFYIPQGVASLNFPSTTRYVSYLQIDNKIFVLSDAGEALRIFMVGAERVAKVLNAISQPEWDDSDKLTVRHPDDNWITQDGPNIRRNELLNPSFEAGVRRWNKSAHCDWAAVRQGGRVAESLALHVWSLPQRANYVTSPLHNVSSTGISGWHPGKDDPILDKDGDWMKVYDAKGTRVFLAYSAKLSGIEAGKRYKLAFDFDLSNDAVLRARVQFYRNNGSEIGDVVKFFPDQKNGRWVSPGIVAPNNAVSARIYLGADSTDKKASWAKFKHVMLCRANEDTGFFSGDSGAGYYWGGTPNRSYSMYWPNTDIIITSDTANVLPAQNAVGSIYVKTLNGANKDVEVRTSLFDKDRNLQSTGVGNGISYGADWTRIGAVPGSYQASTVAASLQIVIKNVGPFERYMLDAGMIESATSTVGTYFDGSTVSTLKSLYFWENPGAPHLCASVESTKVDPSEIPVASPGGANSLMSTGGAESNTYKMGFFYTFENEIGESTPSKITEVRLKRPQANWIWETPNTSGEPSGTPTQTADFCADQLVAFMPEDTYERAKAEGALRWHLYTVSWSDQEPVPVEATLAATREMYPDETARMTNTALIYLQGAWVRVTPNRKFTIDTSPLPSKDNRVNYSKPPKARNGLVAGDRIVLVGDKDEPGAIKWTSNRPGHYTKFTANKGGGIKTLSSGNLHLPGAVVLWQNPQSVDTLTILCLGSDGTSICYYMAPADLTAQTSSTAVMGFEETTNTPGSMAPYGAIVHNNALFRPIDRALLKSTAQNYNINHKSMSEDISNMWESLQDKRWIISAVHDNRLYFLVNNPSGAPVEEGCHGNEIWMYDVAGGESGTWSRYLIQAAGLRLIEYGARVYMGVSKPDGLYYLDPDARQDDYVLDDGTVAQKPIPWFFEMNTQGANKAHDAWAHLQQIVLTLGDFEGTMEYGIRAKTINGSSIDVHKQFTDYLGSDVEGLSWEAQDALMIRRDLMQWFFYARSVEGQPSSGQFNTVQYRYTPVSVNVGYEQGSVETFEYARNVERGNDAQYRNGIPEPMQDFGRM